MAALAPRSVPLPPKRVSVMALGPLVAKTAKISAALEEEKREAGCGSSRYGMRVPVLEVDAGHRDPRKREGRGLLVHREQHDDLATRRCG